ncbi:unnamed protein product [Orchesella dallaii]|uniref:C2H2-type domain-containing protein n=1 Tax=Orchesella dallaii TaxID=48710 RepID=A0ABP1S504_9HEXA
MLLLLRHLEHNPKSEALNNEFVCCKNCASLGKSFCNLFFQMECIQLQLNSKLQKLYDGMLYAGRIPSRVIAFRTQFENLDEKEEEAESSSEKISFSEIQEARNNLMKCCELKLNSGKPRVLLTRISHTEDKSDDPTKIIIKAENQSPTMLNSTFPSFLSQPSASGSPHISKESCEYDGDGEATTQKLFNDEIANQNICNYDPAVHTEEQNPIDNQLATFSYPTLGFEENSSEIDIEYTQKVFKEDPLGMETEQDLEENLNNLESEDAYFNNSKNVNVSQEAISSKSVNKRNGKRKSLQSIIKCTHCPKTYTNSTTMKLHLKAHEGSLMEHDEARNPDYDSDDCIEEHDLTYNDFIPFSHPSQPQTFPGTSSKMAVKLPEIATQKPSEIERREEQPPEQHRLPKVNGNGSKDFKCSVEGCSRVYKARSALNLHVKVCHTPDVPTMECNLCQKKFIVVGQFNNHLRTAHKVQVPNRFTKNHHCVICQRKYSSSKDVYKHIRMKHADVDESEIVCCCGRNPRKSNLRLVTIGGGKSFYFPVS